MRGRGARGHGGIRLTPKQWSELGDYTLLSQARSDLAAFGEYVFGHHAAAHHARIIELLTDESKRNILIIAPHGHAKTTWAGQIYPAWKIGNKPSTHIIFISNTATQAEKPSVAIREEIVKAKYRLVFPKIRTDSRKGWSEKEWFVERQEAGDKDATFLAAGIHGPILGARCDELIFDDVCDEENTATEHQRDKMASWLNRTARSRLVPGGRIVVIMTRWHEDDYAAELIREGFFLLHLPAIGYGGKDRCPICSKFDDSRCRHWDAGEGQALWPEHIPLADLEAIRRRWPHDFETNYQGNPHLPQGEFLKRDWWQLMAASQWPTEFDDLIQVWDTAAKAGEAAAYSACVTMGRLGNRIFIEDVFRKKMEWPELERKAIELLQRSRPRVVVVEDQSSGISLIQALKAKGLPILPMKTDRNKIARTKAISGIVQAGLVFLPKGRDWVESFIDETAGFPDTKYKDQTDAAVHGITYFAREQEHEFMVEYEEQVVISPELDRVDMARGGY